MRFSMTEVVVDEKSPNHSSRSDLYWQVGLCPPTPV
jgi:hypothetical protein